MRARVALLIAVLAGGCSSREHANPFDPANHVTSGRPSGFVAIAGNHRVDLRWDATAASGLEGYQLYRRVGGAGDFLPLSSLLEPFTLGYADLGLTNGVDYEYRLYFVFDRGLGDLPASGIATPGTTRPWVVDYLGNALCALSADGRQVATRVGGFRGPYTVGFDTTSRWVWVSEYDGTTVRIYNPATRVFVSIPGLRPTALAVQQADGTAWVCDESSKRVFHFDRNGQVAGNPIENLTDPIGVAANGTDFSVWVCDWGADRVRQVAEDGTTPLGSYAVTKPSRVAIDPVTGDAWVTSFSGHSVHQLSPATGSVELTLTEFGGPIGIAVDDLRRRVWVADTRSGQVVALDPVDGSVEFSVPVPGAADVVVDRVTGDAWVSTREARDVVILSAAGAVRRRMNALQTPYGIALERLN